MWKLSHLNAEDIAPIKGSIKMCCDTDSVVRIYMSPTKGKGTNIRNTEEAL